MNKPVRLVASTILGIGILAGGRAGAQVFENGPYYANPSWDQQLPASTRFIVLTNWGSAAVLDRETGLVWERAPDTAASSSWADAFYGCRARQTGGRLGWRMPTQEEAFTLLDPTQTTPPVLPAGHPFQGLTAFSQFWTASTTETDSSIAYVIGLNNVFLNGVGKTLSVPVWCVRGGSAAQNPQ